MMATVNLSEGVIMRIISDNLSCKTFMPVVVQVLDAKRTRWSLADGCCCLRLTFSDGSHSVDGVIDKNIDQDLVQSGRLHRGSVVVLTHFFVTANKTLIITGLHVVIDQCELIGEPVLLQSNDAHTFYSDEDITWANEKRKAEATISSPSIQFQSPTHKGGEDDPTWSGILNGFDLDWSAISKELTTWPLEGEPNGLSDTHLCPASYFDNLLTKKAGLENEVNELRIKEGKPSHADL